MRHSYLKYSVHFKHFNYLNVILKTLANSQIATFPEVRACT